MANEIREINVKELKAHPQNDIIYGQNENVADLIVQIKAYGRIFDALKIKEDNVIISGHRRWKAAKELGLESVPCEVVSFESDEEERAALVLYNYKRAKNNEQMTREGMALFETLSADAVKRRLKNLTQNRTEVDESTISDISNKMFETDNVDDYLKSKIGLSRDKVAEVVGIKSGRLFDDMKKVIEKIDELKEGKHVEDSDMLVAVLTRSPSAAKDLIKVKLEELTEKDRKDIKEGKEAPRKFLPQGVSSKSEQGTNYHTKMEKEIESMNDSIRSLEESFSMIKEIDSKGKIKTMIKDTISNLQAMQSRINKL
jgi:hypothetical protein